MGERRQRKSTWWDAYRQPGRASRAGYVRDPGAPPAPPIPDWLREYMLPVETEEIPPGWPTAARRRAEESMGQYADVFDYLMPLGAQEELNPRELAHMAGFLEWRMGGSPGAFPEGTREARNVRGGGDMQSYWDEYVRLSEALFPSRVRLRPRWRTAEQR